MQYSTAARQVAVRARVAVWGLAAEEGLVLVAVVEWDTGRDLASEVGVVDLISVEAQGTGGSVL